MDPAEAVNALEAALRLLVRAVLGEEWQERSGLDVVELQRRRNEEAKSRDATVVSENLLDFTYLYELRKVIDRLWEKFKPVFGDKKRFDVYLDRVEDFRNAPMHSRLLLPFEEELLSGMVGEIRSAVTIFRSRQGPDQQFYPVIDSILDSYGNAADLEPDRAIGSTDTGLRLSVGDSVTFTCRGWDPQGRQLRWRLLGNPAGRALAEATGDEVRLTWLVRETDVAERVGPTIALVSDGKFHRHGAVDQRHMFMYAVNPPHP